MRDFNLIDEATLHAGLTKPIELALPARRALLPGIYGSRPP
ncbi:MAG: hypothetical protein Ct9H300mP8_04760 [Gammaproteobacteria bacterium]|nr:MAG: hypothetical protein Ct9H300mP8_04760 [Gammaproteobacteria bacterium]